jgi:hypothetical protein
LCLSKNPTLGGSGERFKSGSFGAWGPVLTTQIWFTSGYITGSAQVYTHLNVSSSRRCLSFSLQMLLYGKGEAT